MHPTKRDVGRDIRIEELRGEGLTLKEIGDVFGVSSSQIRTLLINHKRRKADEAHPLYELRGQVRNVLAKEGIHSREDISAKGPEFFLKAKLPNFDKVGLRRLFAFMGWASPDLHRCFGYLPEFEFGLPVFCKLENPITECVETPDGRLIAGEAGVGTQVAWCPYCGFKARVQPVHVPYERDAALDLDVD
jgi:DNA-binding CsgD family transcriptional regulator